MLLTVGSGRALLRGVATALVVTPVTLDPAAKAASVDLSNGNLTATINANNSVGMALATLGRNTGKYKFEISRGTGLTQIGLAKAGQNLATSVAVANPGCGYDLSSSGQVRVNGTLQATVDIAAALSTISLEVDFGASQFWVEVTGGTGRKGPYTLSLGTGLVYPAVLAGNATGHTTTANFGATTFAIPATTGFLPWNLG